MASKIKLGKYLHAKTGKFYEVIGVAKHSESLEEMVVYKALYKPYQIWVRPIKMFLEKVSIDGKKVSRFKFISKRDPIWDCGKYSKLPQEPMGELSEEDKIIYGV